MRYGKPYRRQDEQKFVTAGSAGLKTVSMEDFKKYILTDSLTIERLNGKNGKDE